MYRVRASATWGASGGVAYVHVDSRQGTAEWSRVGTYAMPTRTTLDAGDLEPAVLVARLIQFLAQANLALDGVSRLACREEDEEAGTAAGEGTSHVSAPEGLL